MKVLITDDNVDSAQTLGTLIDLLGHEPRVTHSAESALDALSDFRPRVAFLDIGLPVMDGYDLARAIRTRSELHPIYLVAVTGRGSASDRAAAHAAGFDLHCAKPMPMGRVEEILRDFACTG